MAFFQMAIGVLCCLNPCAVTCGARLGEEGRNATGEPGSEATLGERDAGRGGQTASGACYRERRQPRYMDFGKQFKRGSALKHEGKEFFEHSPQFPLWKRESSKDTPSPLPSPTRGEGVFTYHAGTEESRILPRPQISSPPPLLLSPLHAPRKACIISDSIKLFSHLTEGRLCRL